MFKVSTDLQAILQPRSKNWAQASCGKLAHMNNMTVKWWQLWRKLINYF